MAARIRKRHDEGTRAAIQVSQIVNRLQDHILKDKDMTPSQVNAAKILLAKELPDKKQQDINAEVDQSLTVEIVRHGQNTTTEQVDSEGLSAAIVDGS